MSLKGRLARLERQAAARRPGEKMAPLPSGVVQDARGLVWQVMPEEKHRAVMAILYDCHYPGGAGAEDTTEGFEEFYERMEREHRENLEELRIYPHDLVAAYAAAPTGKIDTGKARK